MLTDDKEWSPHDVVMGGNRPYGNKIGISEMNKFDGDHFNYETDSVLGGISPVFDQHLFADRLIASVQIHSKTEFSHRDSLDASQMISEVKTNMRHSTHTPECVSRVFGVGLHKAKQTLAVTTQHGIRHAVNTLNRRYRVDHLNLHRTYLIGKWYLDHMMARLQNQKEAREKKSKQQDYAASNNEKNRITPLSKLLYHFYLDVDVNFKMMDPAIKMEAAVTILFCFPTNMMMVVIGD